GQIFRGVEDKIMTADNFRALALKFPGAVEPSHMNHPDFRVRGKIFATIGPDETWVMVKLTPEQQQAFIRKHPGVFAPCSGAWGQRAANKIDPASVTKALAQETLDAAWQNLSAKAKKRKVR